MVNTITKVYNSWVAKMSSDELDNKFEVLQKRAEKIKREVDIYILQDNFKLSEQKALQLIEKFPNVEESYEVLTSVYLSCDV